jgi:REP element-mobilizing transposase RayT
VIDFIRYLDNLHETAAKNHTPIHAYVLMSNHVHLLIYPGAEFGMTCKILVVKRYAKSMITANGKTPYEKVATRQAWLILKPNLLTRMRYIEMNPVKERQYAYRKLFHFDLEDQQTHEIRSSLNQELVLGRDELKDKN